MDRYWQLYEALLLELSQFRNQGLNPLEQINCARRITRRYRDGLLIAGIFVDPVAFYKQYLPLFEAEVLYYDRLQFMETTRSQKNLQEWREFRVRESNRLNQHIEAHPALYDYYRRQATERDAELFGPGAPDAARHAHTFAGFIALARYAAYAEQTFPQFFTDRPR